MLKLNFESCSDLELFDISEGCSRNERGSLVCCSRLPVPHRLLPFDDLHG